ncbi:TPA: hypothetical protein NGS68_000533 [Vibrio parahaemolyticus]|nr:hypothetical protein [Vibrio parahaemolyticus]HCG6655987.1 hypothetical protein [Vibrio parahaemolyticus]HCG6660043.1 hypothetical protein [Vibrio parahaemolyticus]
MKNNDHRRIKRIFDPITYKYIYVAQQLDSMDEAVYHKLRRSLEDGSRVYLCPDCYQRVVLRGTPNRVVRHYKHKKDSLDCPNKEDHHLTKDELLALKFNGQKEGQQHRKAKDFLYGALVNDSENRFTDIAKEKTYLDEHPCGIDKRWRRPDVRATYHGPHGPRKVVFELQLSTTFLSVIVAREDFYQRNEAFIIWVLLDFDGERYTDLDIAYGNRANAFVLSQKAIEKTEKIGKLWLEVYYRQPSLNNDLSISYQWLSELIPFEAITLHDYYHKAYYLDIDTLETELKLQVRQIEHKQQAEQLETWRNKILSKPNDSKEVKSKLAKDAYCTHCRNTTQTRILLNRVAVCAHCTTPRKMMPA